MQRNVLVTVCILNHNYGRFLAAAIDSVLEQTHAHVDLLVVDDGSTDESREVLERYGGRVRAHLQEQAGQAAAAWSGVQEARGEAIVFLDADDLLEPEICARVAEAYHLEPELAMLQWRLGTIDGDGNSLAGELPPRPGILPSGDLSEHVLRVRNWYYQLTTGAAYATWALRRVLPARLPAGEYHALDQWVNELVPLLGPIRSLDMIGGWHRLHGSNFSAFEPGSAEWPRRMIRLTLNTHDEVRSLAAELGRECAEDARDLRDPALLGWRLWSLTVDAKQHPFPRDRRSLIGAQGIVASLGHPHFRWRHRFKRAVWFAMVAGLPRIIAQQVIARYPSDGPLSTAPGRTTRPSWRHLVLLGLIGGGPTFIGTLIGQQLVSESISTTFLALAAGWILFVLLEFANVSRRMASKGSVACFVLLALFIGFATEFLAEAAGA